jgi:hypothetical protein
LNKDKELNIKKKQREFSEQFFEYKSNKSYTGIENKEREIMDKIKFP